ncbi:Mast/stem cell growth factor receptor kita [Merluccius polli]|uniref:Platelet-derived growth factor receptor-like protein n=1 Tax=Merluccius polli TaxID=89951 RepID=A0AA47M8J4_MERPO|nr:Mast/stem cell growth factor receptor kita [Merluccius polli]
MGIDGGQRTQPFRSTAVPQHSRSAAQPFRSTAVPQRLPSLVEIRIQLGFFVVVLAFTLIWNEKMALLTVGATSVGSCTTMYVKYIVCPRPVISPAGPHMVVPKRGRLELRCHDDSDTSGGAWSGVRWQRERARRLEGEVEEGGAAYVRVAVAQAYHMGRYVCVNNSTLERSSIYVYVRDPQSVFQRTMVNGILVRAGENCTIPCLVTDPAVTLLTLDTCDGQPLPSGLHYHSNPQRGIVIRKVREEYEGCYVCVGRLDGAKVKSGDYTVDVRLVPEVAPVLLLSHRENLILKLGEPFDLTCSSSNVNPDFNLKWDFPASAKPVEAHTSHILPGSRGYKRSTSLWITAVNQSDSGTFRCHAHNEKGSASTAVKLDIRDRGFITMAGSPGPSEVDVKEGESLSLRVEFECYPAPNNLSWAYNNKLLRNTTEHVITVHCSRYRCLTELKLVRVHGTEGGIYTFLANHEDASINQSFTVKVNSKPVIISQVGPLHGQVRCVAAGYPPPKISWYFCELPHTRCSHLPNASQWEAHEVAMVTELHSAFGKSEVESRLNVSRERAQYHTLECVASSEQEEAYTLFSISERTVPHELFRPLLTGMLATGVVLSLILAVLLYNREVIGTDYMPMRPSEKERPSESDDIDELSLDAEDLLSFSYQVAKGMDPYPGMQVGSAFYRMIQEGHRMNMPEFAPTEMYDMMLSCWNDDPLKRPSFQKLVERSELLLSENTKNIYLRLSNAAISHGPQRLPSRRLSSVCSTTASTQPLLLSTTDVFLD